MMVNTLVCVVCVWLVCVVGVCVSPVYDGEQVLSGVRAWCVCGNMIIRLFTDVQFHPLAHG